MIADPICPACNQPMDLMRKPTSSPFDWTAMFWRCPSCKGEAAFQPDLADDDYEAAE